MAETRDYAVRVGQRLREERQRADLTLAQAAQRAGLHPDSLSRLETGRRSVSVDDLVSLAIAYGVSPGRIVDDAIREAVPVGANSVDHMSGDEPDEFVDELIDALPPVTAEGMVLGETMIRQLQLAAVRTLEPIHVRMSFTATVTANRPPAEGTGTGSGNG